jgi:pimeloyl-ACP methyl ester carboxylesterase
MNMGWHEVDLNGARQWVSVRGNQEGPVLLYLHGGPGGAEYGPRRRYLSRLEEDWCVVDWEQRGAGRSFHGDETAADLSLGVLVADGLTLVHRVRTAMPDRPLVLVGHSFGTVLGVLMSVQCPEGIDAYVGASQVVDWALQERRSYEWVLTEAESQGHAKAVAALRAIGPPVGGVYPGGTRAVQVQRRWLGALGGVSGDPRFLTRWMLSILLAGGYPIGTKIRFTKGMARSMDLIWPELGERIHFSSDVEEIGVPIHFFAGSRDRITDVDQTAEWYENLIAPTKRLEVVEGVGHLNLFEAPGRFVEFMSGVRATVAV